MYVNRVTFCSVFPLTLIFPAFLTLLFKFFPIWWMDEWMNEWMDGWMDEWVEGDTVENLVFSWVKSIELPTSESNGLMERKQTSLPFPLQMRSLCVCSTVDVFTFCYCREESQSFINSSRRTCKTQWKTPSAFSGFRIHSEASDLRWMFSFSGFSFQPGF